jgi:hypothetical protein
MAKPKRYKLSAKKIRKLVPSMGGCIATDRITVDGARVGSMACSATERPGDTGWSFVAGDEPQEYLDDPTNWGVYEVNTIANYDPEIIPYLYALPGQRFVRDVETNLFVEAPDSEPDASSAEIPAGMAVVQGDFHISSAWTVELPTPFRKRFEDECLVLWRASLTFWISVLTAPYDSVEERVEAVRAMADPEAFDFRSDSADGQTWLSYRLREATTDSSEPSLYTHVFAGGREVLRATASFDRQVDEGAARSILKTIRRRDRVK